jgi:methionyl aminopeptidase
VILHKTPREIEAMRPAGALVAEAHARVREMLTPGVTTRELDRAVEALFEERGAAPLFKGVPGKVPYPAVTCISTNEQVVHGIPGEYALREGDIVSFDTGCRLNGWCGDAAWTYPVGRTDEEKQRLLDVGAGTLRCAIASLAECRKWSQVASRMERFVRDAGFSVVEEFVGHGIGREMHEDPQVPNFVGRNIRQHDFPLQPGLVLAIEPMVNAGSKNVRILSDHWTIVTEDGRPSVHFEHTVALTEKGPIVLTEGVGL